MHRELVFEIIVWIVPFGTPVKLVIYYLFDIRGAKQSLPNK